MHPGLQLTSSCHHRRPAAAPAAHRHRRLGSSRQLVSAAGVSCSIKPGGVRGPGCCAAAARTASAGRVCFTPTGTAAAAAALWHQRRSRDSSISTGRSSSRRVLRVLMDGSEDLLQADDALGVVLPDEQPEGTAAAAATPPAVTMAVRVCCVRCFSVCVCVCVLVTCGTALQVCLC